MIIVRYIYYLVSITIIIYGMGWTIVIEHFAQ